VVRTFFVFFAKNGIWPLFTRVVTDYSLALINAVLKSWEVLTLSEYLIYSHDLLKGILPKGTQKRIKIHVCCAHFIKIVANDASECAPDKNQKTLRKFLIEILAAMVAASTLGEIIRMYGNTYIILKSKTHTLQVQEALASLAQCGTVNTANSLKQSDSTPFKCELGKKKTMYEASSFYQEFTAISLKLDGSLHEDDGSSLNSFHCPKFIVKLQKNIFRTSPFGLALC
jgi:hypothetical protein